jgi:C4-dicarboxylate-specific signal transduction histidine kinase
MTLRFADVPIRRKLVWLTVLSSAVGLLPAGLVLILYVWSGAKAASVRDIETLVHISADGVTAALTFGDPGAARETLAALRAKPEIEMACLYGPAPTAKPFASFVLGQAHCPAAPGESGVQESLGHLVAVRPVVLGEERIGTLLISQNLSQRQRALTAQMMFTVAILAAAFFASAAVGWRLQRGLTQPILELAEMARSISRSRAYTLRADRRGNDEIATLVDDFNPMLEQIASRDRELEAARDALARQVEEKTCANDGLETAMLRLREAQAQLVQSEKLASLGGLVAGVAHEINTPIGVSVTAASTLENRTQRMRDDYAAGKLTRPELERYAEVAIEASAIILKNLQRAADLIHSFKQVAVDQSSGERRRFGLRAYIDEVLLSLAPRLKKTPHRIEIDCDEKLGVDTLPGALAQILTNLVSNSLLHAFPDGRPGVIRIQAGIERGQVHLRFSDDGVGVPPENVPRIFDPFFTTRRGLGGSGLGLHIVYNLATQMLRGSIRVESQPGAGTDFHLRFPATLPGADR